VCFVFTFKNVVEKTRKEELTGSLQKNPATHGLIMMVIVTGHLRNT
jgi:hypothetical protein